MKKLFIVGLWLGKSKWEFFGVFDNTKDALERCSQEHHFIGEAFINERLPEEKEVWPNFFYPNLQETPTWFTDENRK